MVDPLSREARVGEQPRVDTFGERKTAHVFGVISLEKKPLFFYRFASVFNGSAHVERFLDGPGAR
ncbi:MAG: hypothetical protein M5U28_11165 [Sandaracinaceae bacterium]|nr:hypothetical protein [Sandaracinaceae bacterium]